jgi:hypothetical protein
MAFTGSFFCTSCKRELLQAIHDFTVGTGDVFNIALYTNTATLNAATTAYTASGEVPNGGGYTARGVAMGNVTPSISGVVAFTNFAPDPSWLTATFTARGALIFNTSKTDRSVAVLDFGSDKTVSAGTFTVVMPANVAATALLRLE